MAVGAAGRGLVCKFTQSVFAQPVCSMLIVLGSAVER